MSSTKIEIEIEQTEVQTYNARTDSMKSTRAYRVWVNGDADVRYWTSKRAAQEYARKCRRAGKLVL